MCVDKSTMNEMDSDRCATIDRPVRQETCNEWSCQDWTVSPWNEVSWAGILRQEYDATLLGCTTL